MNSSQLTDPCILFAMVREWRGFGKLYPPYRTFSGAPCWAKFCGTVRRPILVLGTGIGPDGARQSLEWILGKPQIDDVPYEPKLVLFAGFAGSLSETLGVGDLVLAREVVDVGGKRWPTTWPGNLTSANGQPHLHQGTVLSSPRIISSPEEKRRLGQTHGALAVDMESATCARICSEKGIPFGCLRAISDDVATPLAPDLVSLLSGGKISWWRVLSALCRRPTILKEFLRLGRDTRLASDQLGKAIGQLLTLE